MPAVAIITAPNDLRDRINAHKAEGRRVGLVPTMGALHAGHVSLVQVARRECDVVVATIFVNPTQFGPGEDLAKYPRDLATDLRLLEEAGCDLVFTPTVETMYPAGCETTVDVGSVARPMEGEHRPTHFTGVATIVLKLFQIAPASIAYFGQKDYQQTLVIERMVADLNVPIELCFCPIVREPDGLAMSSRNAYLSPDERRRALSLSAGLQAAEEAFAAGQRDAEAIRNLVLGHLRAAPVDVQYVSIVRYGDVKPVDVLDALSVVLIAAQVGKTRLIDNVTLK